MNADYQVVYDASARIFRLAPAGMILLIPIIYALIFSIGGFLGRRATPRLKLMMWGAYAFYAVTIVGSYWQMWQGQTAAADPSGVSVVEGRLSDGWVREKSGRKTTDVYQHFSVRGVEFLYHHRRRNSVDFMMARAEAPELPLIDGAHVRITYRGEGGGWTILKFEIASKDLPADANP